MIRGSILVVSIIWLLMGLVTCLTPGVNNIFLPLEVTSQEQAIMVRSMSGIFIALGYLSIRFVFSSSKVQIGSVLLTIVLCGIFSKVCSFIYDGYTNIAVATFFIGIAYAIGLYVVQKARKNELDYNL